MSTDRDGPGAKEHRAKLEPFVSGPHHTKKQQLRGPDINQPTNPRVSPVYSLMRERIRVVFPEPRGPMTTTITGGGTSSARSTCGKEKQKHARARTHTHTHTRFRNTPVSRSPCGLDRAQHTPYCPPVIVPCNTTLCRARVRSSCSASRSLQHSATAHCLDLPQLTCGTTSFLWARSRFLCWVLRVLPIFDTENARGLCLSTCTHRSRQR